MTFTLLEDTLGWTTTIKKGARIADANGKPVLLRAGEELHEVGVSLDVEPVTLFVTRGGPEGEVVEVRRARLAPKG